MTERSNEHTRLLYQLSQLRAVRAGMAGESSSLVVVVRAIPLGLPAVLGVEQLRVGALAPINRKVVVMDRCFRIFGS
jgi:hypothetical protein